MGATKVVDLKQFVTASRTLTRTLQIQGAFNINIYK